MRKIFTRWSVPCAILLLALGGIPSTTSAQSVPWHIDQGSDGTLYLLTSDTRYVVNPDAISDDSLAALIDGGVLGSQLPLQPAPVVVVAPAVPLPVLAEPTPTLIPAPTSVPLPTSTPVPPTAIPTPVAEQPSTVSGSGDVSSRPFSLHGGNYTVSWTFTSHGNKPCYAAGAALIGVDGGLTSLGGRSVQLSAGQSSSGDTQAYNLVSGQFYAKAYSDCDWSVTVKPQ